MVQDLFFQQQWICVSVPLEWIIDTVKGFQTSDFGSFWVFLRAPGVRDRLDSAFFHQTDRQTATLIARCKRAGRSVSEEEEEEEEVMRGCYRVVFL